MESCRWCGASVSPKDVLCPRCGARLRRESSTCRRCRKEIRSGLAVCPHCGEDLLRRSVPWKLIGSVGGVFGAAVLVYLVLAFVPLPFQLPLLTSAPIATATEVILPPTPTGTATPRRPTATPTRRATATPVITETATLEASPTHTVTVTATSVVTPTFTAEVAETATFSPRPTGTPAAYPTEVVGYGYAAPQLLRPADETDLPENQFNFSNGSDIDLAWEPVDSLGENQWYELSVTYTGLDGRQSAQVNWTKGTSFRVPLEWHDHIMGGEREVYWRVTVVSGTPGTGAGRAISPASETWMFRWG